MLFITIPMAKDWVCGVVTQSLLHEQPVSMANSIGKCFGRFGSFFGHFGSFFGRFGSFLFCCISQAFLIVVWRNLPDKSTHHKGFQDSFSPRLNEQAKKNPQHIFDQVWEISCVFRSGHHSAYTLRGAKPNPFVKPTALD